MSSGAPAELARVNPVLTRLRAYGTTGRIVGIDIARGLAVLGMFGAHVGVTEHLDPLDPSSWIALVHGRSSILFAVLAGVSIAIISGRTRVVAGRALVDARLRILVRAVVIFALGGLLEFLGTGVAVILPAYALLFVLAIPFLRWSPRRLFLLAGILSVVSPVLTALVVGFVRDGEGVILDLLVSGVYPGVIWITFVLVGLGIGRLDLDSRRVRLTVGGAGAALTLVGYGIGAIVASAVPSGADAATRLIDLTVLASIEAHSGSPFEVIGSTGFALAVIALSLLAAVPLRWLLFPVAAVGAMALTAYTLHIFAIAALGSQFWRTDDTLLFGAFVLAALLACSAWYATVGRGPLEQVLTTISTRAVTAAPHAAGRLDGDTLQEENTNT